MKKTLLVFSLLLTGACGLKRVPDHILENLPYEARIELLEAENDLALAIDRVDESHNEMLRTRDAIRRAKDRLHAAGSEVGAAQDAISREVAELTVAEGEARVDYLRAKQRVNVKSEDLADQGLRCARARFEQARLAAARKAKVQGSESLDPARFEQQTKACDADYDEMKAAMKETTAEADQVKIEWDRRRAALAKKTFDARASPYVQ